MKLNVVGLLLLLFSACAPLTQKMAVTTQKPYLGSGFFTTGDGKKLVFNKWSPKGEIKAIIIALHGFNDYKNAFEIPASEFAGNGIMLFAYDQRGFGEDDKAGIWPSQEVLIRDLNEFSQTVKNRYPKIPIFILGESMGGSVAILQSTQDQIPFTPRGMILVGPAVWGWSTMNPFYKTLLWISAHLVPSWSPTGESLEIIPSDNVEMLRELYYDPLVIKKTRIDAIYGLVGLMDKAYKSASAIDIPTLALFGKKDEVIPNVVSLKFRNSLSDHVVMKDYDFGYHMLLRDKQRSYVIKDIVDFIEERLAN